MNADVRTQLERYCAVLAEDLPTITPDDAMQRVGVPAVRPLSPKTEAKQSRPWVAVAAAFVVVMLVGGAALWITSEWRTTDEPIASTASSPVTTTEAPPSTAEGPTTTAASVTTAAQSTSSAPSTTAAASVVQTAVTWERAPDQASLERAALYDVVEYGGRLVAVGYALEPDVGGLDLAEDWASDPAVWVSDDGVEWRRVEDPDLESDDQFGLIHTVVAGPAGLLAFGDNWQETIGEDYLILWSSSDGEEWDRVAEIGGIWPQVVPVDDGWLAIGEPLAGGPQVMPQVMRSSDGSEWAAVTDPAFASLEPGYTTAVADVAVTDGGIVAVGEDLGFRQLPDGIPMCGAIWFSPDGETWERIAPERICEAEASFSNVAVSPSGAVYALGDRDLWVATDPAEPDSWQPVGTGDGLRCAPEAWLGDIVVGQAEAFRSGRWGFCVSEDAARTWLPVDRNDGPFADADELPADVVAFDGRFVAIGYYGRNWTGQWWVVGGGTGAVWIGTPGEE